MASGVIKSNLYTAGQQAKSVYPGTESPVYGQLVIPANTSFQSTTTADRLWLFDFPGPSSHLLGGWIDFAALDGGNGVTFSLVDTLATPNTIVSGTTVGQAGGFLSIIGAMTVTQHGLIGYPVIYTGGIHLELLCAHSSTNTSGASALTINFFFSVAND